MVDADLPEFAVVLDAVCAMLSRGAYTPNDLSTSIFFRALQRWPLADVRAAFDAHVSDPSRGKFVPVPADLIAQLEARAADDGRPGPEEAWGTAIGAANEADTVVWTHETAQAWGIARPVLAGGDEIGARMAFREAYARLVAEARADRRPIVWQTALGADPARRADALRRAADVGRLPRHDAEAAAALPAPRSPVLLLANAATDDAAAVAPSQAQREAMAALRKALQAKAESPSADALQRERTAQLKAQAAQRVSDFPVNDADPA